MISNNLLAQNFVDSLNFYYQKKDFDKAIYYGKITEKYFEKKSNLIESDYAYTVFLLATMNKNNFDIGKDYYDKTLNAYKPIYGERSYDYSSLLLITSSFYQLHNDFVTSLFYYKKYIEIRREIKGINDIDFINSENNLAYLYFKNDEYSESENIYVKIIELQKNKLGINNFDYFLSISGLATLYYNQSKYNEAEKLFLTALEIIKTIKGENTKDYLTTLDNLALLYTDISNYKKAEEILKKVINNRSELFGDNNLQSSITINNLANLYLKNGNYTDAEKLYVKSLIIEKNIEGEENINYLICLNNIAYLYSLKGDNINAEKKYQVILEKAYKILAKNNIFIATVCNNIASTYLYLGNAKESEFFFKKAIEIYKTNIENHKIEYANTALNLGSLYEAIGNYSNAEHFFLESLNIRKKYLGENHPDYENTINHLALLYELYDIKSNKEKVSSYLKLGFYPFKYQIIEASSYLSEKELKLFQSNKFSNRFFPLSFLQSYPTQYSEINIGCYENELLVKNLSLRNQQRIKTSIEKSDNVLLKEKYQQFIDNKRQLAKLEELPIAKRSQDYESLKTATEIIEKDLTRQSSVFADAKKSLSVTWKAVQDKLQPNEVAIDLVAYNYYNRKWTDSIVYAAFVVGKDFKAPKYIPLFEKKQLEILLHRNSDLQDSIRIDKHYTDKAISDLFFKPLEKELEGKTTLYLSPAGLGHQIDFSALPISETQTLGEKYQVHVLGSTAELVSYSAARLDKSKSMELLLYGGIDYSKSKPTIQKEQEPVENNNAIAELRTRSGISGFDYLPGTNDEVNQIAQLGKENGFATTVLNEANATEESIKLLDGRTTPYVLHLATHGFFFADPKQELPKENLLSDSKATIYKTTDDPMMRSGLLFAGANKYWNTTTENLTTDDGIMTANEISNLDLSACQLVVLSACETGLGTIIGSEGVFGLQRAFKMAGVKNIIMSLWKVPDAQTAELFSIFYKECLGGKSIHEAFQLAQAKMRAKYSPYYWAGFVLLE